jgi:hypothetical protein
MKMARARATATTTPHAVIGRGSRTNWTAATTALIANTGKAKKCQIGMKRRCEA